MYLLVSTLIYSVITQVMNIGYILALGIYIIGLALIKGWRSDELEDVFNIRKTKDLYKEIGLKDSLTELLSFVLIFLNSYIIAYEPFTLFEYIFLLFVIAFAYRFLFWGITRAIKERG